MLFLPVTVSAANDEFQVSLNGLIYVYCENDSSWKDFEEYDGYYQKYSLYDKNDDGQDPEVVFTDNLDSFLAVLLYNSDVGRDYITIENIQSWRSMIVQKASLSAEFDMIEAVRSLMSLYIRGENARFGLLRYAFTWEAYKQIEDWLDMFEKMYSLQKDLSNPIMFTRQIGSGWYNDPSVMLIYESSNDWDDFADANMYYYCSEIHIQGFYDYEGNMIQRFQSIFDDVVSAIDIRAYVSWLPQAIASNIIVQWGVFFSIVAALVVFKVLHG
ncbi:MAG: hypothetical protein J6K63_02960 [Clostridia bacterium]|nr:hypothetical protein [Clostridia bacterium]